MASRLKDTSGRRRPAGRPPVRPQPGPWLPIAGTLILVALLVLAFLAIRWATTPPAAAPHPSAASADQVVSAITGLPAAELDQVGAGSAQRLLKPVPGQPLTGADGKPEVLYVGAEYCPFCAAQRWPTIIALSRFGTFSGLTTTTSSATDTFPSTPTFTFRGSSYRSQYLDFVAVELLGNQPGPDGSYKRLQSLTPEQQALVSRYDAAPYTGTPGAIPFIDFGNRFELSGSMYSPDVIHGMSWQAIADALRNPSSSQARATLGSANLMTAAICQVTGQQPSTVCADPGIQSLTPR
jgi:hypothetical protein